MRRVAPVRRSVDAQQCSRAPCGGKAEPDVTELPRASARIASLEARRQAGPCTEAGQRRRIKLADAVGETEAALHAFRLAERRRDSQRKLEQLAPLFSATLPAPVQALAVSTLITEKNAPRLVIAADARGSLHLLAARARWCFARPRTRRARA